MWLKRNKFNISKQAFTIISKMNPGSCNNVVLLFHMCNDAVSLWSATCLPHVITGVYYHSPSHILLSNLGDKSLAAQ